MSAATETELIACPLCGARNRVPVEKLRAKLQPICGRCKSPLSAPDHPVTVTDENYAKVVEQSLLPVLLDMWAEWCGPCRMIAPTVEQLARELQGRVRVAKLNVDENPMTASRYGVRSIPTLLVIKGGREVDRLVGALPKQEILRRLQAHI